MPDKKQPATDRVAPNRKAPEQESKESPLIGYRSSQSTELLNIILNASNIGIWTWNIESDIVHFEGRAGQIYGLANLPTDLSSYKRLVYKPDRPKLEKAIEEALSTKNNFYCAYRIINSNDDVIWIESFGKILCDEEGEAVQMCGYVRDIHEKKLADIENEDWKKRQELITSSARLVMYDYDIDSGSITWSGACLEVLGYHPYELSHIDDWARLIHHDDATEAFGQLEISQRTLSPYDVHYRLRKKDGDYSHFHDRGLFTADNGVAKRMLGIMNDVTARVCADELLRQSEQRYRTLQEASFGGIGLHNKGRIVDCNHGLSVITGYSHKELIGSDGLLLIAPEYRDEVRANIVSGYEKTYDVKGIRKDGSRYFLEIRGKNISFEDGSMRVTEFRDITERKRNEEIILEQNKKLVALAEELQQKNSQLEEFTQIVSHNLRSPVGNMLTLLTFYEQAHDYEEKAQYIHLLKESSSVTLTMLNELNEVLKIRQSNIPDRQTLRFEEMLKKVSVMLNAKIASSSAIIAADFEIAPDVNYAPIYLESIFLNLLDNALKYCSPARRPAISLRTYYNDNENLILEVSDNGMGINMARYSEHIFKLRKTFHQHPESRGIGLFMIKNQVEAMGGEITVASTEGEGTVFFINFNKHHLGWDRERQLLQS